MPLGSSEQRSEEVTTASQIDSEEVQELEEEEEGEEVARPDGEDTVHLSMEFPNNLETVEWLEEQVKFLGPLIYQDTRLGEARHRDAKIRKRIVSGRNDWADILRVVRHCIIPINSLHSICSFTARSYRSQIILKLPIL